MITTEYPIKEWEVFQTECSNEPSPAFYFSLTPDLKRLLKDNNNWLQLKIKGTNSAYDDQVYLGFVDTSANMPNNRPNFYEVEGLYVFTLKTTWKEYPKNPGTFEILNGVLVNYSEDKNPNTEMTSNLGTSKIGKDNYTIIPNDEYSPMPFYKSQKFLIISILLLSAIIIFYITKKE
jgi:hypothetical protein